MNRQEFLLHIKIGVLSYKNVGCFNSLYEIFRQHQSLKISIRTWNIKVMKTVIAEGLENDEIKKIRVRTNTSPHMLCD